MCERSLIYSQFCVCVFSFRFFRERVNCFSARGWLGMVPLISRLPELMVFGSEMFCVGFLCEFFFCSARFFANYICCEIVLSLRSLKKGGGGFLEHLRSLLGKIDT